MSTKTAELSSSNICDAYSLIYMNIKRATTRHLPQFVLILNSVLNVSFVHTEWKTTRNEKVAAFSAAATCLSHYVNVSVLIKFSQKTR